MGIAPLGNLLIPLGALLLVFRRRWLLWVTVASLPAFHVSIFTIGETMIRPYQYFAALLLLGQGMDHLGGGRRLVLPSPPVLLTAVAFLLTAYASLVMPVLLHNEVMVAPMDVWYPMYDELLVPLQFSPQNVSQMLYPTFAICLFLGLRNAIRTPETLRRVVRISLYAAVVIAISGFVFQAGYLVQGDGFAVAWSKYILDRDDPIEIVSTSGQIYGATQIRRMFSLVGEPGYTAFYLSLAAAVAGWLAMAPVESPWRPRHCTKIFYFTIAALLMNGSTNAVVAIAGLLLAGGVVARLARGHPTSKRVGRVVTLTVVGGLCVGFLFVVVLPLVIRWSPLEYFMLSHASKLTAEEGSGPVRWRTVVYSMGVFLESPVLGVGYGSHRSAALVSSLLSNVGAIGTACFVALNWFVFCEGMWVLRRGREETLKHLAGALMMGFVAIVPIMFFAQSMSALNFGWYWLLLAMVEACYRFALEPDGATSPRGAAAFSQMPDLAT